jgi:hypothetical protein
MSALKSVRSWLPALLVAVAGCAQQVQLADPSGIDLRAGEAFDGAGAAPAVIGAEPAAGEAGASGEWVHLPMSVVAPTSGGVELDEPSRAMLRELAESVASRSDAGTIRIEAHDDGPDATETGRARAEAAVDYLVSELGVPRERIVVESYGNTMPLTSETTAADRALNRRLEFSVLTNGSGRASPSPRPPAPAYSPLPPSSAPVAAPAPTMAMPSTRVTSSGAAVPAPAPAPAYAYRERVPVVVALTAASVGDADRRGAYLDYLARHPAEAAQIGLDMSRRVRFRVLDSRSRPVPDAVISFDLAGARVEGRTHADGWWDFYPGVSAPLAGGPVEVMVSWGGARQQVVAVVPPVSDGGDVVVQLPGAVAATPTNVDLAFVIDVTGSMGDELAYVNAEVQGIVQRVRSAAGLNQVNVRLAATFYRDRGDVHPLQQIDFTRNVAAFNAQLSQITATGGGDYPEDVNAALDAALTTLGWSSGPAVRVLVLIGDAPPQRYPDQQFTYREAVQNASRHGIRILPVAASGADREVEYLWRAMGAATSTPYVYLTDDSGIGASHQEADTDRIDVEMFSDLLTRLLISDLQGLGMHELSHAGQEQIVMVE